ncbi:MULTISPECIES: 2-isopropylmalate synthase [Pseudomonadaceae]|uniref:2-isopropylmalate synthase n=1 Tax=Ectopseudomonas oleovorans TaxID=301 RepID=A0A653B080_ECTOL|nr:MULTISPECIES: 2-isopropylmalate synthase [Pseudomonas]TNF11613.1 MAG: 2-isopropylmalate synthase [Pseudomonadales bacterium]WFC63627.1 2-isopropylmalate synthase [Pseudomonas sp. REST10]CAE6948719.1 2-isopropylmalate synthase [Pseudomonas oleovorans]HIQ45641.1 2-isopropylmalate synthase [Pseudomonas oleovorans]|tara:strand:+ start:2020 stop:3696 length:1677 start_codon:yes stop_codon:yes gene_type:complete
MTMLKDPSKKYRPFTQIQIPDRTWPDQIIDKAPIWLSTDLRDGNQSLIEPMDAEKKMRFFKCLVAVGLKEIEVGFPSASQTDFDFVRELIEGGHIPDDVTIQVLTQARDDLIERTFESLKGAKKAIVHYYNACAPSFRKIVFNQDKAGVKAIAVAAGSTIKRLADAAPETQWGFEYSPEVFSSTEIDFAVEVCNAVIGVFQPTPANKLILNLPATIECATPNNYADQIEWFGRHVDRRDSVLISVHTHNDRGTGVAASELAVMAGADRVEGCLFGNGERTGNVCLVTLALNLYTQGIDPELDFSDIDAVRKVVEDCNQIPVHPRHPYVGDLVHTAFSGSHQDAIRKGFAQQDPEAVWEVPYLPIDPADIGRDYEAVIRVNSQSGKGGITFLLEQEYGINLPRRMQIEFSQVVQRETDRLGLEMTASQIHQLLESEYLKATSPYELKGHRLQEENGDSSVELKVQVDGQEQRWNGSGKGPLEALVSSLPLSVEIMDYHEHAIGAGASAKAASYIEIRLDGQRPLHGIGIDENITTASFRALFSALNRAVKQAELKTEAA